MQIEARFTLIGSENEIPFTIVEEGENELFLYSIDNGAEYRFQLANNEGLLSLIQDNNPFSESKEILDERMAGLSADWLENKTQGFDSTTTFEIAIQPGYGPDDIFVENKPFSLRQIVDLIDNGDIELTPDFQRNFIWDRTRQSRLIESILLGLPLPSLYLSQYEDGRLTVVDGLQRLSTIRAFMNDQLTLNNLEYLGNCNGKKFSQLADFLSPLRIRKFGQTQIMCFVLDYRSPTQLKFDLFRRLNTGGKPLNNQEIRNCLSRPEVQGILKRMIDNDIFRWATSGSVKDNRMEAREAALRYIYFYEQHNEEYPIGRYNGDMERTLDGFIDELNKRNIADLENYINLYVNSLRIAYHLFGDYCFRKVTPDRTTGRRTAVNKLMMLTISVLLSKYDADLIEGRVEFGGFLSSLADLISEDGDLFEAITWGTNGKWNMEIAFSKFKLFFDTALG